MAKFSKPKTRITGLFVALILGYGVYLAVGLVKNVFSNEEKSLIESREQIAQQQEQIKSQQLIIEEMRKSIEQLKASNELTLSIVKELNSEQKKIEINVKNTKKWIDKSLAQVDSLDISDQEKEKKRSQVLIKGLNQTYCQLFENSCVANGVNK
jgi:predicted RNase H-like nuclease (RuvC/YqgF family)